MKTKSTLEIPTEMESIVEYLNWCWNNNYRGFQTKVRQNNTSAEQSKSQVSETAMKLKDLANETKNEKERAVIMEAFKKADNTEQILRKRWGNTLKLIGKSNAEIKREAKKAS